MGKTRRNLQDQEVRWWTLIHNSLLGMSRAVERAVKHLREEFQMTRPLDAQCVLFSPEASGVRPPAAFASSPGSFFGVLAFVKSSATTITPSLFSAASNPG